MTKIDSLTTENKNKLKAALEGILFIATEAVAPFKLAEVLDINIDLLDELILELQEELAKSYHGLALIKIAGGYRLCTKNSISEYIDNFTKIQDKRLSQPLLETLSIIAFKQPVTKQEVEEIRGVNSDKMIRRLLERELIREVGRKRVIGRPILYGTTVTFLQCFGLKDLQELPELPDLSYEDKKQIFKESNLFNDMDLDSIINEENENMTDDDFSAPSVTPAGLKENVRTDIAKENQAMDPIDIALSVTYPEKKEDN